MIIKGQLNLIMLVDVTNSMFCKSINIFKVLSIYVEPKLQSNWGFFNTEIP